MAVNSARRRRLQFLHGVRDVKSRRSSVVVGYQTAPSATVSVERVAHHVACSGLQVLRCVTRTITICGDDVTFVAHFDFDSIATSSRNEKSVEGCENQNANNLAVVADVADGFPR